MGILPFIAAITDITLAFLLVGISLPLVHGHIPMNKAYGIRFAKSFESEEQWFKINRYGGKQIIIWSIPIAVVGLATLIFPMLATGLIRFLLVACIVPMVCVLIAVVTSYRFAKKQ